MVYENATRFLLLDFDHQWLSTCLNIVTWQWTTLLTSIVNSDAAAAAVPVATRMMIVAPDDAADDDDADIAVRRAEMQQRTSPPLRDAICWSSRGEEAGLGRGQCTAGEPAGRMTWVSGPPMMMSRAEPSWAVAVASRLVVFPGTVSTSVILQIVQKPTTAIAEITLEDKNLDDCATFYI